MDRPKRPCTYPGCSALTTNGRCDKHQRQAWTKTKDVKRMTGRKLQKERERLFAENPLCVECEKKGIVRAATQRDHIVPLFEWKGDPEDPSNIQGLCESCHKIKTAAESARGRDRNGS